MDPHFFQRQLIENIFFVLLFYVNVNYLVPKYLIKGLKTKYFVGVAILFLVVFCQGLLTERAFQPFRPFRFASHEMIFPGGARPGGPEDDVRLQQKRDGALDQPGVRAGEAQRGATLVISEDKLADSAYIKKYGLPPRPVILPQGGRRKFRGAISPDPMRRELPWLNGMDGFAFFMVLRRSFTTSLLLLLVGSFWKLSFVWSKTEKEKEALEKEKLSAELRLLKSQINPHFLFNVLNSLYALSYKEQSRVSTSILKLSYIMRYMIYDTNAAAVQLQKEVDYIENYIALQRLRMPDFIDISFKAEGVQATHFIEPMLLLPFIENAFKHGVSYLTPSKISIRLTVKGDELYLEVDNPVVEHKETSPQAEGGVGLTNVRERLKLLYGNYYTLKIQQLDQRYMVNLYISLNKIKKDLYD
jgi:hypothetical protein